MFESASRGSLGGRIGLPLLLWYVETKITALIFWNPDAAKRDDFEGD